MTQIKNISYDGLADGLDLPTNGTDPGYTGNPFTATGTYRNTGATMEVDDGDLGSFNYHSFTARTNAIYLDAGTGSCACGWNDINDEIVAFTIPYRPKALPPAATNSVMYQTKSNGSVASQVRIWDDGTLEIRPQQVDGVRGSVSLSVDTNYWIRFKTRGHATLGHIELELYDENLTLLETIGDFTTNYNTVGVIDFAHFLALNSAGHLIGEIWVDDADYPALPTTVGVDDPLSETDIEIRYSTKAGTQGDSLAGTQTGSLGKYVSQTPVAAGPNGTFDDVSAGENATPESEYRCFFVVNTNTTYEFASVVLWLQSEDASAPDHALGVDPTAVSDLDASSSQAVEIADEDTAPAGVSFTAPTTKETGLSLGIIGAGQCKAFWVRRTTKNSGAINGASYQFRVEGVQG